MCICRLYLYYVVCVTFLTLQFGFYGMEQPCHSASVKDKKYYHETHKQKNPDMIGHF